MFDKLNVIVSCLSVAALCFYTLIDPVIHQNGTVK